MVILGYLWSRHHITPLQIARKVGPFLSLLIKTFVKKSSLFSDITDAKVKDKLRRYVLEVIRRPSSAEVLMCHAVGMRSYDVVMIL